MEQTKQIGVDHHGKDAVDFAPFEHNYIGHKVCMTSENWSRLDSLKLPNGLVLSLGQIIALAGDFYGVPKQPIIDPYNQTDDDRYRRFIDAYNSLAREPKEKLKPELNKLLAALEDETRNLQSLKDKLWDEITGGKWFWFLPVKHGRMLKLAKTNHDHFLPYAKEAYVTGHKLAMDKAREASCKTNAEEKENLIHEALSLDGFACHFLTDSFSSGHIRTPRVALAKRIIPRNLGHCLSKHMHDEDGKMGLHVTNKRGDKWIVFGDGLLLNEDKKDNLKFVIEAVRKSVDQVFEAYNYPSKDLNTAVITDIIPSLEQEGKNHAPLFQVKDGKLYTRSILSFLKQKLGTRRRRSAVTLVKMRSLTL